MTRINEIRELDGDELETRLAEYRRELVNLRFQVATGQLDNVGRIGQVRRDVARALTVMRQREIDPDGELFRARPPARASRPEPAAEDAAGSDAAESEEEDE